MATQIASISIRDTSAHTANVGDTEKPTLFQIVNGLDQSLSIAVYGTRASDDTYADRVELTTASPSAGGTIGVTINEDWDQMQIEATASTAPTSGTVDIYQM